LRIGQANDQKEMGGFDPQLILKLEMGARSTLSSSNLLKSRLQHIITNQRTRSGPVLVSRIGDAGCTESGPKRTARTAN